MIDERFLVRVADLMLPRPVLKKEVGPFDDDRAESLSELGVISLGFRVCLIF